MEEQKEYIRKTQADKPVNSCGSVDERIRMSWLTYPHKKSGMVYRDLHSCFGYSNRLRIIT